MQALSAPRLAAKPVARSGARSALNVVCKATTVRQQIVKKVALLSTLPAAFVASPAFALVDDRLNGDGTGLAFGVNEPVLGLVLVGVFSTMWAIWFTSQRDLGDFEDNDAGLKL
ncbi:Photosystem II reaction center W protein, chloroplastic [Tetrabaena socialis]|uniref:PSII 6.1 kDa protein n=1 Tax=Tetrabaena socialis TaxID=47790 RepID=A0A2J7ZVP8_9CHLO|nr:Photosystem II reaction center W protein, chloroplastic [Tetrabaena socialis]|eukprot:PNH04351.1 Photosystem II reaction center W protein, chloroplastic [Tetrabaena socialis]